MRRIILSLCLVSASLVSASRQRVEKASPARGSGFWSVKGTDFVDAQGNKVYFSGVVWSGFETPDACIHGLWMHDINWHLDKMKSQGFNMIRLPFAGDTLRRGQRPQADIYGRNPGLRGKTSLELMDLVIDGCKKRGIKVILDYHRIHLTISNELGTWWDDNTPESVWINNWKLLATRYKGNPTVIGADLFNEVHGNKAFPKGAPFWSMPMSDPKLEKYNFRSASLRVIKEINAIEPNWILFLEGMWQEYWWGGNLAEIQKAPITQPAGKIALSSHEYGPVVAPQKWFFSPQFPRNLVSKFREMWGFPIEKKIAPVWVGEFGSFYPAQKKGERQIDYLERTTFETLIGYINTLNASWTIAFWNPNSKDTGGILRDDWRSIDERKMKALKPIMHPGFRLK